MPLINISALQGGSDADRQSIGDAIGRAFHEIGFIVIEGHGIPQASITALRQQVIRCFQLPAPEKMALSVTPDNYRGYIPLGFFTPNAGADQADNYEGYKLHWEIDANDPVCADCDLYGPNKWPLQLPELRAAALAYWSQCDRVAQLLLGAIAQHLELDEDYFISAFEKPLTNMTLLHYPAAEAHAQQEFGIHPHKDTDALTILAPDPVGGLFVRPKDSDHWIAANAPPGALIINIGDMLEIWSGGYFVSTPHKVENPSGQERYSFPYFAVPRFDVDIKPVTEHIKPEFKRAAMQVGDVSRNIWHSNWPDATPVDPQYDPYTH